MAENERQDDAKGAGNALRAVGSVASGAARGVGAVREGLAAMRDVREISRLHASAKADLRTLKAEIERDTATLEHRRQVERDYDRIVAEETAEIESARQLDEQARQRIARLEAEREELSSQLSALKADNEERLRPYRSLVDSTKGRADDAAVALADARRAVKSAETAVQEATRRREQRISSANHAVDNAQERLRKVQGELDKLQSDPNASISALPRMRDEVTVEHARLDAARKEVETVTSESQQMVDNAQTHLWTQKQSLELAERQAEETKREATERRTEYDSLYKEALAKENELEDGIKERNKAIAEAKRECEGAQARIDDAQTVLDEANDIHDNPQVTAELGNRIAASQTQLRNRTNEVKDLARTEKHLRKSTRKKRVTVIAALVGILVVVFMLVWFVFLRGCSGPASTTSATSSSSTSASATSATGTTSASGTGTTSGTGTGTATSSAAGSATSASATGATGASGV